VNGGVRYDLELGEPYVPAILLVPREHPAPAALLLHGLGSRKERMADTVGLALLRRGVAALAVDLPHHGARGDQGLDVRSVGVMRLIGIWSSAVAEARAALEYLRTRGDIDATRLGIVGYSLGSFLANVVAADEPAVGPVVLAAGGDLPDGIPFESMVRAAVNPLRAVRAIGGRPLLMINGRYDRTVTSAQAKRLFEAAGEPKAIRWYNGGHWPPDQEIDAAAEWLSDALAVA
jgi:predicted esterase